MTSKPANHSMTRRLVAILAAVVTAFWLIAAGLGMVIMQLEFSEIFDGALQQTTERLLPLVVDTLAQGPVDPNVTHAKPYPGTEYLTYQARRADGSIIMRSDDAPAVGFDAPLSVGFSDTARHRIYTAVSLDGTVFVQVADAFRNRREAIREGGWALFLPLLLLVPASMWVIMVVVRRLLGPIETLRADIGRKDSGNLAPLDETSLPRELLPIAHSVNLLLERLRSALEAEREFTSNSAHELRTPIAGALAQTQRLLAEAPPAIVPRLRQIEASLQHLGRLGEKLLQLSRAEAGIGVQDHAIDLIPILTVVVDEFERGVHAGRLGVMIRAETFIRAIDADAFAIVLRNVIENALIHSPPDSPVAITITADTIRVQNHGSVIPSAALKTLSGRFVRATTQANGSGLGLSIVNRLVTQMNGRLTLQSPAESRSDGVEVIIRL